VLIASVKRSELHVLAVFYSLVGHVRLKGKERGQEIHITVLPGRFNLYWHNRKAKAMDEEELGWDDWCDLNDYQFKLKLGVGRW